MTRHSHEYMARYMADRYLLLKIKAVEYKGGKCKNCGYDKCYASLEFHHRDPKQKDASWNKLRKRKWSSIVIELDKCDLLCSNCHKETHCNPTLMVAITKRRQQMQENRDTKTIQSRNCNFCDASFLPTKNKAKYCSPKCAYSGRYRIDWPQNLPELVAKSSKMAVAISLGVSDKAVAKRLLVYHTTD